MKKLQTTQYYETDLHWPSLNDVKKKTNENVIVDFYYKHGALHPSIKKQNGHSGLHICFDEYISQESVLLYPRKHNLVDI